MTRNDTSRRARRGYLILIGLFIAAVLIFNLQAVQDLTRDRADLVALLPDASGVRVGTPVLVAGRNAGRVTRVSFLAAGDSARVALHVRVRGDALSVIRRDSDVRAVRVRMIGQPVVQIDAGSATAPAVDSGDTLRAHTRVDPAFLLEQGKELPASLDSLLTAARRVADMVAERQPDLTRLQVRIDAVTAAAGALSGAMEEGSLGAFLAPGGLNALTRLRTTLDALRVEVEGAMGRFGTAEDDGAAALSQSLTSLRERVATLRLDVDALSAKLDGGGGTLDRMARDSAIQVAIRGVQAQIDTLRQEAASIVLRMYLP